MSNTRFTNWARNQTCTPAAKHLPRSEDELATIVAEAHHERRTVRCVGSGHSFSAAVLTDDVLISLDNMSRILEIDRAERVVRVEAGISLAELVKTLDRFDLALPNLGDIAYQTVAGAISTSTHGTGLHLGGLATQVIAMRLVLATGDIVDIAADDDPALLQSAAVSLGALGVISSVTIQCVDSFNLRAVETPEPLADVLATWTERCESNDHFEFLWIPGTDQALTKSNNRTAGAIEPIGRFAYARDKIGVENVLFGGLSRFSRRFPASIPTLASTITRVAQPNDYSDASWKIFASARWVRFVEMEYAIAFDVLPDVVREIDMMTRRNGHQVLFPVEARAAAADDLALSTAHGRTSAYVAVHMSAGRDYRSYFKDVEAIASTVGGRPHWGKLHFKNADDLAALYPSWSDFAATRDRLDPTRTMSNAYVTRVLGP